MAHSDYEQALGGWKRRFWLAIAIYAATVTVAVLALNALDAPPPGWAGPLAALLSLVPALYALLSGVQFTEQREGVERMLLRRSTSAAFFFTMALCVSLGLVEAFSRTGPISAWWIYGLGMSAWVVANRFLTRRLA